ncbi:MAG: twin-arginine translocation pathway signal protein [Pseudomonadota bacterium]
MTTRRQFLTVLGGAAIFAASGCSTTPRTALAPWEAASTEADPRRFALSHAILAPNPHNLQPWQVSLNDDGSATLFHDPTRALPETDPFDRQITIGLGCFLEQMKVAASAVGYRTDIELFPQGWSAEGLDTRPVAQIAFVTGAAQDPLFAAIPERRSAKVPFDMAQPVPAAAFAQIDPGYPSVRFGGTTDTAEVTAVRELMWDAWVVEAETARTFQESVDLMRLGRREIDASPDGIDLGGGMMEGLIATGMVTREKLATPGTTAYQTGWDMYQEMLTATPAAVWLTTPGNTREDQIAAGAAWLRLNLLTTVNGLALHPVSQCLQEYPEMAADYARAHTLLARGGETVQMLGRLGYAEPQPKTPRWSLDDKLV